MSTAVDDKDSSPIDPQSAFDPMTIVLGVIEGNLLFASANTFMVPPGMTWAEFRDGLFLPWISVDPDFEDFSNGSWSVDGSGIDPNDDDEVASLGIGWKSIVRFTKEEGTFFRRLLSS